MDQVTQGDSVSSSVESEKTILWSVQKMKKMVCRPQLIPTPWATFAILLAYIPLSAEWWPWVVFLVCASAFVIDVISTVLFFIYYLCTQRPNKTVLLQFVVLRFLLVIFFVGLFFFTLLTICGVQFFQQLKRDSMFFDVEVNLFLLLFTVAAEVLMIYCIASRHL